MRRALITGVARGIGAAAAALLHDHGWQVLGLDVIEPSSGAHLARFERCDLGDADTTHALVEQLADDSLDLLVNNAAVQPLGGVTDETPASWDHAFAVNVRGAWVTIRAATSALRRAHGAIVNVASIHALATSPGRVAYVASKGALMALTRSAALELAPEVRVNAVLPGAVGTVMLEEGLAGSARLEDVTKRTPLRRLGNPEDIAQAILFFGDGQRSAFVTGQALVVDGGVLARLASE